jgi:DNA polymerase
MGIISWQLQNLTDAADSAVLKQQPDVPEQESVSTPVATQQPAAALPAESADVEARWKRLEQAVGSCEKCEALCASRTQTVFGVGNHQAELFVIGEAPGRDEDQQGEPFVGRAGQLLNAMLKAIGLQREQVFIANILKCRPPDNRDPRPQEAANCSEFLRTQIDLVQPKVILVVGRIAAQNLLATQQAIGKLRGRQHSYNGTPVIVTYHPAYLLRKPSEKRKSWQDLLQLKKLI